jgi:hypothetical protein
MEPEVNRPPRANYFTSHQLPSGCSSHQEIPEESIFIMVFAWTLDVVS